MYVHLCQKERCPSCNKLSCSCERQKETIGNNYNELCPHCGAIIMSATITTSDTNYNYYENSKI